MKKFIDRNYHMLLTYVIIIFFFFKSPKKESIPTIDSIFNTSF